MPNGQDPRTDTMLLILAGGAALLGAFALTRRATAGGPPPTSLARRSPCPPLGDPDGDGWISEFDVALILNYEAHLISLSPVQLSAADVNRDGVVNSVDALLIEQFLTRSDEVDDPATEILRCQLPVVI